MRHGALVAAVLLSLGLRARRRSREGAGRSQEGALRYVALGDSLTVGVGALPGYPARVAMGLRRRLGREVRCANLGRIRMTSVDLARALRSDPRLRSAVAGADLITLCVGGNDLLRCGADELCLERSVRAFPRRWEAICQEVRRLNSRGSLVALTLYCPYPPGHPRGEQGLRWVERMNRAIRDPGLLAACRVHLVDIAPVLHGRQRELTWIDLGDLHPTGFGQQLIAAAVVEGCLGALAGAASAPPPAGDREAMGGVAGGPEAGRAGTPAAAAPAGGEGSGTAESRGSTRG